jgi:hypothetical protein
LIAKIQSMLPCRPPAVRPTGPDYRSDLQARMAAIIAEAKAGTKDQVCPEPLANGPVMRVAADRDGPTERGEDCPDQPSHMLETKRPGSVTAKAEAVTRQPDRTVESTPFHPSGSIAYSSGSFMGVRS